MLNFKSAFWTSRSLVRSGVTLFAMLALFVLMHSCQSPKTVSAAHSVFDGRIQGGSLVISGGGFVSPQVRQRFLELAGGSEARIVVIPAVDPAPGTEDSWLAPWRNVGAKHVELCNAHDRAMANTANFCAALNQATGVWFSGGYQNFLAQRYVDTAVQKCLNDVLARNGVVGGTSAGAAILSDLMIQEGENQPVEARGLGMIPDVVIDQHFLQRNRLWRMQQILEAHPSFVGLGVDENTALIFERKTQRLSVLGESYAMVCVPAFGTHSGRTEVLHAGDDVLLPQLRKRHLSYEPPVKPNERPIQMASVRAA